MPLAKPWLGVRLARVSPRLACYAWRQKVYTLRVTCRSGAGLGVEALFATLVLFTAPAVVNSKH